MEPPWISCACILHEEEQDVPGEGSGDFCPCSELGLMPVLLGEVLPRFPGRERGKLALSWVKERARGSPAGRELLAQVWDPQGLVSFSVVAVLEMGLAVGTIPAGAGES